MTFSYKNFLAAGHLGLILPLSTGTPYDVCMRESGRDRLLGYEKSAEILYLRRAGYVEEAGSTPTSEAEDT